MFTGSIAHRIRRRGCRAALAALAVAACAAPSMQAPATAAALAGVAAAVTHDVYGRRVALGPLLADRAVLFFFRTDCRYCAAELARARSLAGRDGTPPLVLISRQDAAALRAALGPAPRAGLVVVSDSDGAVMRFALPTWYVPRVIAVAGYRVRLDRTGGARAGLAVAARQAAAP